MRGRVLVTRPEPGASATARRLVAGGFSPVVLPLSETRALPVGSDVIPVTFDAVAITSANAVRHAASDLLSRLAAHRCFAVADKTAAAARRAGFSNVIEGPGDAGGLAALMAAEAGAGAKTVYLCGRVRFPLLERSLGEFGLTVITVETYDTTETDYEADFLASTFDRLPVDAVLLYSVTVATAFSRIRIRSELGHYLEKARVFALSPRVAAALAGISPSLVRIAAEPTEDALFERLESEC